MRITRKLASLLLALVMALALCVPAFAASGTNSNNGKITINNAVVGQTYNIYQILTLESYNTETSAYAYKANSAWSTFINSTAINGVYVNVDNDGYVTWKTGADAAAFAKAAQAYAKENPTTITADGTVTATTTTAVAFTGLNLGYYLVDSTLGTLCSLDTTSTEVTIQEKNAAPSNVKTVQEDSKVNNADKGWGATNDADIGQTVNFQSTITAQAGAENYVFHDKMSAGLTLDKASIKVNGVAVTDANGDDVANDNYTVSFPSGEGSDGCTFEIAFAKSYLDTITQATTITITYSATLNSSAVVGLNGNPNSSKLSYGEINSTTGKPTSDTPDSITTTYTWDVDVLKYANGVETNVLAGVKFVLLNSDKSKVATVDTTGKLTGWVAVPTGDATWDSTSILTTNSDGKICIDGLDADTYYLREIEALPGFNVLSSDQEVKIDGATKVEGSDTLIYITKVVKINNQSGTQLPSTGGIGTTLFYIAGGVLVVGAAVLLVTKRRMER